MERPRKLMVVSVVWFVLALLLAGSCREAAAESDLPLCEGPLVATTGKSSVAVNYDIAAQALRVIDETDLVSFSVLLSASNASDPLAATAEVRPSGTGQNPANVALANSSFVVGGPGVDTEDDALLFTFNATNPNALVRLAANTTYWLVVNLPSTVLLSVTNDVQVPDSAWPITLGELRISPGWTLSDGRTAMITLDGCHAARASPSATPSSSPSPSNTPSGTPSPSPSRTPTPTPSISPTPTPTPSSSPTPTPSPSNTPSTTPTPTPSSSPSPLICGTLIDNTQTASVVAAVEFPLAAQRLQVVDDSTIRSFTIRLSAQNETTLSAAALHVDDGEKPGQVVSGAAGFNVSTTIISPVVIDNVTQSEAYTFDAELGLPGVRLASGIYWLVVTASEPQGLAVDVTGPVEAQWQDPIVLGALQVDDGQGGGYVDTGRVAAVSFDGCHAIRPTPSPSPTPSRTPTSSPTPSISVTPSPSPSPVICDRLASTYLSTGPAYGLAFNSIAQRVRVYEDSRVKSFTVRLAATQNDSALASAGFYSDNAGLPGDVVPDTTFEVTGVNVLSVTGSSDNDTTPVSTVYTFNSTIAKGARLPGANIPYWLVLTAAVDSTLAVDVVSDALAADPLDSISVRVNRVAHYMPTEGVWMLESSNVTTVLQLDGCHAIRPSPSPSTTPSSTPSTSPTSSPSPSRAPEVTAIVANVTTTFNNSAPVVDISAPITSAAPTPTPTPMPSIAPSSEASPQPTDNGGVTPSPLASTTATASPSPSPSAVVHVSVTSSFTDIQVGNVSVPAGDLGGFTLSVINATHADNSTGGGGDGGGSTTEPLTYVYTAKLDNSTTFEQAYTFHERSRPASFANLSFAIAASSLKWSINLTSSSAAALSNGGLFGSVQQSPSPSPSPSPSAADDDDHHPTPTPMPAAMGAPLVLRYKLKGLLTSGHAFNTTRGGCGVIRRNHTPRANMTTYYLPLVSTSALDTVAAQVEVFDVALLDGHLSPIQHDIVLLNATADIEASAADHSIEYVLELSFPPFETSLYYDPSLGLGVLLGSDSSHDGGGGGGIADNTGLLVALAVVLPLAALVVVAVVVGGFVVLRYRKRLQDRFERKQPKQGAVYFDDEL